MNVVVWSSLPLSQYPEATIEKEEEVAEEVAEQ